MMDTFRLFSNESKYYLGVKVNVNGSYTVGGFSEQEINLHDVRSIWIINQKMDGLQARPISISINGQYLHLASKHSVKINGVDYQAMDLAFDSERQYIPFTVVGLGNRYFIRSVGEAKYALRIPPQIAYIPSAILAPEKTDQLSTLWSLIPKKG
ncbi:hypothetical protein [Xenorhabdus nematophila]|uniref:hypothetical protein n=2 Tax=Xenorhabdus nematophila TaxID=628 RepID=UPI001E57E0AC|nr:hypothetical protein [Xenorhabdus nematophila]